jgi:hypothetical protein
MSRAKNSKYFLVSIALGVAMVGIFGFSYAIPRDAHEMLGICFLAVGILFVSFHRKFGSQPFERTFKMPGFRIWETMGVDGSQTVFLGIGLILAAAGFILILGKP